MSLLCRCLTDLIKNRLTTHPYFHMYVYILAQNVRQPLGRGGNMTPVLLAWPSLPACVLMLLFIGF